MNKSESKYFNTASKMDEALIKLLEDKSFEYITVSDICKQAGVNRSTFYLHYENTHDLLEETTRYLFDSFLSYFSDNTKAVATNLTECDLSELNFIKEDYLIPYLTYFKNNRRVFSTILAHSKTFETEKVFHRLFQNIFDPILSRFHYPIENRKYVMMFYLNGISAIISEWIRDDCEKPIEDVCKIIQECIFGRYGIQFPN